MANIERILGTDSGKVAFEKTDRNMVDMFTRVGSIEGTQKIKKYNTLEQIGLKDTSFAGLDHGQAFNLLITKLGNYASLSVRCDSSFDNFRKAIYGYGSMTTMLALFEINTYSFTRYDARISDEGGFKPSYVCSGRPDSYGPWLEVAHTKTTLEQIGLKDADMSTTDFSANALKMINALGPYRHLKLWTGDTHPNLTASILKESGIAGNVFEVEINTSRNSACTNQVILRPNTTHGQVPEWVGYYDNSWGGFTKILNDRKGKFSLTAGPGMTIVRQQCFRYNDFVIVDAAIKQTGDAAFPISTHNVFNLPSNMATGLDLNRQVNAVQWANLTGSSLGTPARNAPGATILNDGKCWVAVNHASTLLIGVSAILPII